MKTRRLSLTDSAVMIACIIFLMGILMPALRRARQPAIRLICQTNLTGIGRAMAAYASDNEGSFPRAGTADCVWSTMGKLGQFWHYPDPAKAFNLEQATITSSFYLLIKHYQVLPKQFLCKGDEGVQEFAFTVEKVGPPAVTPLPSLGGPPTMLSVWDFGGRFQIGSHSWPWPGEFVSYTYHMPYVANPGGLTFTISDISHPRSPVCADRNPFLDKNVVDPKVGDNSASHLGKGQNVLYKNLSVVFEKRPTVGLRQDNIYTYRTSFAEDPMIGKAPTDNGDGAPLNYEDAYLVGEKNY
ncbi:MAG: hypothetical protein ACYS4W_04145 [Planctomycetota bacterium]|jgi:hypothetical protein